MPFGCHPCSTLAAIPGGIALSWVIATALIVLLINAWLLVRLLRVSRSARMAANPVWNRRNVRVVVRGAADLLVDGRAGRAEPEPATRAFR
jgi:hypothetical protein